MPRLTFARARVTRSARRGTIPSVAQPTPISSAAPVPATAAPSPRSSSGTRPRCGAPAAGRSAIPTRAADAAQDAVLTALLSLERLRDGDRFGAWLTGIGLNHCRHALRTRARAPVDLAHDDRIHAPSEDLDAALDADAAAARIRAAIATLPPGQRAAVELFYLAGLTHAEAAAHLDVPPGAVKARLHKARHSLRDRLAPVWKEQFAMSEPRPESTSPTSAAPATSTSSLLAEDGGERELTIWVGAAEATQIAVAVEDGRAAAALEPPPHGRADRRRRRPAARGARSRRLAESIFYADVVLDDGARVDARPSDGIVLAARRRRAAARRARGARRPRPERIGPIAAGADDRRVARRRGARAAGEDRRRAQRA